jgi:23S rRNA G2445 N2-methylase RlmL
VTLLRALADPGFVPRDDQIDELFELVAGDDRKLARRAERVLVRKPGLGAEVVRRLEPATPPLRARLARLLGRLVETNADLAPRLFVLLDDGDLATRRQAVVALGKLGGAEALASLAAVWRRGPTEPALVRALVEALGRVGDAGTLDELATLDASGDPQLARVLAEARSDLERRVTRTRDAGIDAERHERGLVVRLHVRRGLEPILREELPRAEEEAPGRLRMKLDGPLGAIFASRTLLRAGFPLRPSQAPVEEAVVTALASDEAWRILAAFGRSPIRYRIEWAAGPRRRAMTRRVADAVRRARPALVNDPVDAPWEAVVEEQGGRVFVELWPRGLADPRFDYRRRVQPASSHPTIAAALARVAGARADDVVWDPFAGTGTELVERARLGPYRLLFGSDRDAGAVDAARENLAAARVVAEIVRADVASWRPPEPVTLLLTNPPMGKRIAADLDRLYATTFERAAAALAPGGRFVWISPRPDRTLALARANGFTVDRRMVVDMGGFWAELQRFRKTPMSRQAKSQDD